MIKIDKHIPLPSEGDLITTALKAMEVGDSFLLGDITVSKKTMMYRKINAVSDSGKRRLINRIGHRPSNAPAARCPAVNLRDRVGDGRRARRRAR